MRIICIIFSKWHFNALPVDCELGYTLYGYYGWVTKHLVMPNGPATAECNFNYDSYISCRESQNSFSGKCINTFSLLTAN